MTRLCVVTDSAEIAQSLTSVRRGDVVVLPRSVVLNDTNAVAHVMGQMPSVVLLDVPEDAQQSLLLAEVMTAFVPVIMRAQQPAEVALPALRAGVRDVLAADATAEQYWDAAERAAAVAYARESTAGQEPGRVLTVLSPKGGVGKTTVATNLAVGLAQALPQRVVLVDLDLQFGDVASALDLDPEYSIVDGVRGSARDDAMVLKTYLTQHRSGLFVVAAPASPEGADQVTPADAADLLRRLAAEFAYVVVDTAPGLTDHSLAALDVSTDMVLLTALDVPGVRGLRRFLDILAALGSVVPRSVVLNMVDKHGGLTAVDAAATISAPIDVTLPRCKSVLPSVNRGVPLLESGICSPFAARMEQLVRRIAPDLPIVKRPRTRLGSKDAKQEAVSAPRRAMGSRPTKQHRLEGGLV